MPYETGSYGCTYLGLYKKEEGLCIIGIGGVESGVFGPRQLEKPSSFGPENNGFSFGISQSNRAQPQKPENFLYCIQYQIVRRKMIQCRYALAGARL